MRSELKDAALGQDWVGNAPADLVYTALYEKTTKLYGDRGVRYADMEAGHSAQNVYLQAAALDLGTVVVGAFNDTEVKRLLNLSDKETPLYIMPVGRI